MHHAQALCSEIAEPYMVLLEQLRCRLSGILQMKIEYVLKDAWTEDAMYCDLPKNHLPLKSNIPASCRSIFNSRISD